MTNENFALRCHYHDIIHTYNKYPISNEGYSLMINLNNIAGAIEAHILKITKT